MRVEDDKKQDKNWQKMLESILNYIDYIEEMSTMKAKLAHFMRLITITNRVVWASFPLQYVMHASLQIDWRNYFRPFFLLRLQC